MFVRLGVNYEHKNPIYNPIHASSSITYTPHQQSILLMDMVLSMEVVVLLLH